jgi:hypothetical protein
LLGGGAALAAPLATRGVVFAAVDALGVVFAGRRSGGATAGGEAQPAKPEVPASSAHMRTLRCKVNLRDLAVDVVDFCLNTPDGGLLSWVPRDAPDAVGASCRRSCPCVTPRMAWYEAAMTDSPSSRSPRCLPGVVALAGLTVCQVATPGESGGTGRRQAARAMARSRDHLSVAMFLRVPHEASGAVKP